MRGGICAAPSASARVVGRRPPCMTLAPPRASSSSALAGDEGESEGEGITTRARRTRGGSSVGVGAADGESVTLELRDFLVRVPPHGADIARVTLTLAKGQIVFVVGKSGAGKSVFLRSIAGLEATGEGDLERRGVCVFAGKDPFQWGLPNWRARVSYVSQNRPNVTGTPRDLHTAAAALAAQRTRRRPPQKETHTRASRSDPSASTSTSTSLDNVAGRLGLDAPSCLDRAWSSLSGGEAHRALLAVHLAVQPDVLLLDEPTAACDAAAAELVEAELARCGAGILWVSHDPTQPQRVGGRVYRFPPPPDEGAGAGNGDGAGTE